MRFPLLQPLRQIPIAVIDTETTGISSDYGHRVIEVGIVRMEAGAIVKEYQQLIDPGRCIGPAVTAMTGITQEMVAGQPRFEDQLPGMMAVIEGAAILGHNIDFDLSFLRHEFRRLGMDLRQSLGDVPVLDTLRIARRRFGRGGNSLPVLSRRLGVEPVAAHRALADAHTTAEVFRRLLEPVGGYAITLCDTLNQQGGAIEVEPGDGEGSLPIELQEALEGGRPVMMEYLDGRGARTHRVIQPLQIRRHNGQALLVAHCHLRNERRTFKIERIVHLTRLESEQKDDQTVNT